MFGFIYVSGGGGGGEIRNRCRARRAASRGAKKNRERERKRNAPTARRCASTYTTRFIGAAAMILTVLHHYPHYAAAFNYCQLIHYASPFRLVVCDERLVISHSSASHVIALGDGGNRVITRRPARARVFKNKISSIRRGRLIKIEENSIARSPTVERGRTLAGASRRYVRKSPAYSGYSRRSIIETMMRIVIRRIRLAIFIIAHGNVCMSVGVGVILFTKKRGDYHRSAGTGILIQLISFRKLIAPFPPH